MYTVGYVTLEFSFPASSTPILAMQRRSGLILGTTVAVGVPHPQEASRVFFTAIR